MGYVCTKRDKQSTKAQISIIVQYELKYVRLVGYQDNVPAHLGTHRGITSFITNDDLALGTCLRNSLFPY